MLDHHSKFKGEKEKLGSELFTRETFIKYKKLFEGE